MNESKIVVRYSKALFEFASEANVLDKVKADVEYLVSMCSVTEFAEILKSPIIQPSGKQKLIYSLIEKNVSTEILTFLDLLTKNKREAFLPGISRKFISDYYLNKGIKPAVLTTPISVDKKLKDNIITLVKKVYKTDVILEEQTDPSIIGGFVLTVEDQQYDASVATQLKNFNYRLVHETFKKT